MVLWGAGRVDMVGGRSRFFVFWFFLIWVSAPALVWAQRAPRNDVQNWYDVVLTIPANERMNLVLYGTARLSLDAEVGAIEERAGVGVGFKLGKRVTVTPTYLAIFQQPVAAASFTEHRPLVDVVVQVPVGKFTFTDRNRLERRFLPTASTTRYRNRLMIDYQLRGPDLRVFIYDEVFYDFRLDRWALNRIGAGVSKAFNKNVIADIYYVRQNNAFARPGDLHVLGLQFRLQL